jgi:hypothetical protein
MVDEASARRRGPVTATARQRLQRVANVLEAVPSIAPLAGCRRKGLVCEVEGPLRRKVEVAACEAVEERVPLAG